MAKVTYTYSNTGKKIFSLNEINVPLNEINWHSSIVSIKSTLFTYQLYKLHASSNSSKCAEKLNQSGAVLTLQDSVFLRPSYPNIASTSNLVFENSTRKHIFVRQVKLDQLTVHIMETIFFLAYLILLNQKRIQINVFQ